MKTRRLLLISGYKSSFHFDKTVVVFILLEILTTSVCSFLQQDDERIIQEIQKEGETELNKKSAGQY